MAARRRTTGDPEGMAARMAAAVTDADAAPVSRGVPPAYTRKTTLTLTDDDWRELTAARLRDGTETAVRLRALVALYRDDEAVRERVDSLARGMRRWA